MKKTIILFLSFCTAALAADVGEQSERLNRQSVLKSALSNNPAYLAAMEDSLSAKYSYRASWAEFLPAVYLSGIAAEANQDGGAYYNSYNAKINAEYIVFNGFRSYHTLRSAKANYELTSEKEKDKLLQTIKSVNLAYQNVLRADYLRKSAETSYESANLVLEEAELKLRLDLMSRAELYSARADKEKAYSSFLDAQTSYKSAVLDLASLAGMDIYPETQFTPEERHFTIETLDSYLNKALESNALLRQSALNKEVIQRQYNASYANFMPSISLNASMGWYDGDNMTSYDAVEFGVSAHWYLFSGLGDMNTALSNAKALNSAEYTLADSKASLIKQVHLAHMNAESSFEKVSSAKAYMEAAQENYTAMQEMFRLGRASLKDTVDARQTLEDAQASLADANYTMIEAFETLAVLTGTAILPE